MSFAPNYFSPVYFAPSYFPSGINPLPYDLMAAVVAALGGIAPSSLLPGGAHEDFAGPTVTASTTRLLPYCEVYMVSRLPQWNSCKWFWGDGIFQVNTYNGSRLSAQMSGDAVAAVLNDNPLTFQNGFLKHLRESDDFTRRDKDPGPGGLPMYVNYRTYNYSISNALS